MGTGKSKRKILERAIKSLSSKSSKIKKNKGGCHRAEKVTTALKSAISVVPGVKGNVASQAVASKVTPFIQEQVYPKVLSRCIPEDILYDIAVKRSLEDCESADEKSVDLKRFKFENVK